MSDLLKIPGKRLGRKVLPPDPRNIRLADHLNFRALPPPPESGDYTQAVKCSWGDLGNRNYGCCVEAAGLHHDMVWEWNAGRQLQYSADQCLNDYRVLTGFSPNDPYTDHGTDPNEYFKFWRDVGIAGGQHKIAAWAFVDPASQLQIKQTLNIFEGLYCCFVLPAAVSDAHDVWDVPSGQSLTGSWMPGSWGGHAVTSARWGMGNGNCFGWFNKKPGFFVVSWGDLYFVTYRFAAAYGDLFAALISPDQLNGQGKTPAGLDLASLQAALTEVGQLPADS